MAPRSSLVSVTGVPRVLILGPSPPSVIARNPWLLGLFWYATLSRSLLPCYHFIKEIIRLSQGCGTLAVVIIMCQEFHLGDNTLIAKILHYSSSHISKGEYFNAYRSPAALWTK